ncbi:hypothetical protein O0I10_007336 [Lichtheimia ornata]|uniref:C3H1-type domain-containing protein n=1 Tax=Lichtheimia ornata TaxID=688661 RepID=A0AAD7V2N1_9FUNG|nr:uncharacterized protein O0I10_007336 [Lichtheimia ornata]KAJ8657002.1 hypothetical protein O0I10_007336 [Lichtheimia ornata]
MAFTQTILTRPTLLVSALVLTVGTVICYNYLSKPPAPKDSDKDNTRSISSVKKDTQKDKASETPESTTQHASATNPEQHDTKNATTHETTPLNNREINNKEESTTAAVQQHDAVETEKKAAAVIESTKDDTIAPEPVTKEQASREMKPAETKTTKPEPVEIESAAESKDEKIESAAAADTPVESKDEKIEEKAAEKDTKVEKEDIAQVESSTAEEDAKVEEKAAEKEDTKVEEKAENITQQQQQQPSEEGAAPSSPLDSSSTTSSSSGSAKQMDESYPTSTLTTPSASKSSSTYWQQPNNDPMSQYGFAWPTLIPVPEFRPQQQQNQQSFYSNEAGNPIPGQDENRPRGKKGRRVKKRLSRVERIEEQRQTHKPTMKSRCDYWPYCSNRNCKFIHPVKPCRVGDGCGFGNRCMFLHPSDYID